MAIVSLQQVAVIPASNVGLKSSGCCATAGVFFLMVELLFFALGVFVGRFLLLALWSRCLTMLFCLNCCVATGGFYLVYGLIRQHIISFFSVIIVYPEKY